MEGPQVLTEATSATLRTEGLRQIYGTQPDAAVSALASRFRSEPTSERRLALAEICADHADALLGVRETRSLGLFLDTLKLTEAAARAAARDGVENSASILYNEAAIQVTRLLRDTGMRETTAPGALARYELEIGRGPKLVDPSDFDLVVPAAWLDYAGIDLQEIRTPGFGAPMVGHFRRTDERLRRNPNMADFGHSLPLNARVSFRGTRATLSLQNLMSSSQATIAGQRIDLAGDYTAALAFLYHDRKRESRKILATLRPAKFQNQTGLFSIEPFREDKIPLVIVHGLLATAEGWLPFVNQLRADPVVRERYQMVFFNYPSGLPIQKSSAALRKSLRNYAEFHDPDRSNPRMREVVLLGHSMGGVLSSMQIRDAGQKLERLFFEQPIEKLDIPGREKAILFDRFHFEANPDVSRAILMASPHRGSDLASNPIGQFGAWIIRLPFDLIDSVLGELALVDALTDVAQDFVERPPNSVSSLRPDNPILTGTVDLPIRKGVRVHSIIAREDPSVPLWASSDGIVPYTSAHLEEADSELIIENADHHSIVTRPETLREVWRLLRAHAGYR